MTHHSRIPVVVFFPSADLVSPLCRPRVCAQYTERELTLNLFALGLCTEWRGLDCDN